MNIHGNIEALIAARLAAPKAFRVTTQYECGKTRNFDVETMGQAENHAAGQRLKMGRDLIHRKTGEMVRVVDVSITEIGNAK